MEKRVNADHCFGVGVSNNDSSVIRHVTYVIRAHVCELSQYLIKLHIMKAYGE